MDQPIIKVLSPKVNPDSKVTVEVASPEVAVTNSEPLANTEETKPEIKLPVTGKTEPEVHALNAKMDYTMDPLFYQVANYLGIKPQEHLVLANKLNSILDWAVQRAGTRDTAEVLYSIRQIEKMMPHYSSDERRYAVIYRYIKLMSERDAIDKQIQSYHERKSETELDSY